MNHKRNYDQRAVEQRLAKEQLLRLQFEAQRSKFEAKNNGERPKLKIGFAAWANALVDPPFGMGDFTWQLTITFPFPIPKGEKMKRFWEEIEYGFEKIFLS